MSSSPRPVRILCVADVSIQAVIGGAERVLFEQSIRLARQGARGSPPDPPPGDSRSRLTGSGVEETRYAFEPDPGLRSVAKTWRQARGHLVRLHTLEPFDCLNIHQPLTAFGVLAQAAALGIRPVYTCHSLSAEEYLSRQSGRGLTSRILRRPNAAIRHLIEGRVLRRCDRIMALSRYSQEKLRRVHGIPAERVTMIPGGVDWPASGRPWTKRRLARSCPFLRTGWSCSRCGIWSRAWDWRTCCWP